MGVKNLIERAKCLFFGGEGEIFSHKANGEPCAVCRKPMHTRQKITMTGDGEKMHSKCWPEFFRSGIESLRNKVCENDSSQK